MRLAAGLLASALLVVGCATGDSQPPAPSAAPQPSPTAAGGPVNDLYFSCAGKAAPTVLLVSGLGTSGATFHSLQERLARTARTCWYDRAGVEFSAPLPEDAPDPSPGSAAGDLRASLAAQGLAPPYVVLGWSYGGLVAQAYATAYPQDVAGLVLEDTSVVAQFTDPAMIDPTLVWREGGRDVDTEALVEQLGDLEFGDLPLAVLSADVAKDFGRRWLGHHDDLASTSTDGVHVVGLGSGHAMHEDVPDLVAASVEAVWAAAAEGAALGVCDVRFTGVGGRCRQL